MGDNLLKTTLKVIGKSGSLETKCKDRGSGSRFVHSTLSLYVFITSVQPSTLGVKKQIRFIHENKPACVA